MCPHTTLVQQAEVPYYPPPAEAHSPLWAGDAFRHGGIRIVQRRHPLA